MNKNKLSRRDFLKMAGVTSAGLALSACGVDVTKLPSATATAVASMTPSSTNTFTPTPETLATLEDLSLWVDDFINANGGKIKINEIEMNANELTGEIRKNPNSFTQTKATGNDKYSFLIVNDVPLAIAGEDKKWNEASLRKLAEIKGIELEFAWAGEERVNIEKYEILSRLIGNSFLIGGGLQTQQIFQNFTTSDWQKVVNNWAKIKEQLQNKEIPSGYPYFLDYGKDMIRQVTKASTNGQPKMRGGWLMHGGALSLGAISDGNFSGQELSNILEFAIKTAVLNFPEVQRWNATDEIVNAFVITDEPQVTDFRFWYKIFNKTPQQVNISDVADLVILITEWIKAVNENIEIVITEDAILDFNNPYAPWSINAFNNLLEDISKKSKPHLFKGIDCEFNLWVYDGLDIEKMKANIQKWKEWGFQLFGSETMVLVGDKSAQRRTNGKLSGKIAPIEQQDLMYSQLLQFYIDAESPTLD